MLQFLSVSEGSRRGEISLPCFTVLYTSPFFWIFECIKLEGMLALVYFIPRLANHSIRVVAFRQSIRISFGKQHKNSNHLSSTSLPAQVYLCLQGFGFPLQIGSYFGKEITDV